MLIKINSNDTEDNDLYQSDLKKIMPKFVELGVEIVEFSGAEFKYKKYSDHNYFLKTAMEIKGVNDIPVMVVGGVRNFVDMEEVLSAGADMVSLSRPLICEPDLITRLRNGQVKACCVSCNKCPMAGRDRCILKVKKG